MNSRDPLLGPSRGRGETLGGAVLRLIAALLTGAAGGLALAHVAIGFLGRGGVL